MSSRLSQLLDSCKSFNLAMERFSALEKLPPKGFTKLARNTSMDRGSATHGFVDDLVSFIPRMCNVFEMHQQIDVIKIYKEKLSSKRLSSKDIIETRKRLSDITNLESFSKVESTKAIKSTVSRDPCDFEKIPSMSKLSSNSDHIIVQAFYDIIQDKDTLVELAITHSNNVPQMLIKVIVICLQLYPTVTKFTMTNCKVSQEVMYEIGQLLPQSQITEICLDNTKISQLNYYCLFDHNSQLQHLSLNRCRINDLALEEICKRIDTYPQNRSSDQNDLQVLELSCNLITDSGAALLGKLLKTNRKLLHLNLSGNKITGDGAIYILNSLMKFQLTPDDVYKLRETKIHYYRYLMNKTSKSLESQPFRDSFDDQNVIIKDGLYFCIGNFRLCSLNLAYNDLQYAVNRAVQVLRYQSTVPWKPEKTTGLVRLVLGGADSHQHVHFEKISQFLQAAVKRVSMEQEKSTKAKKQIVKK